MTWQEKEKQRYEDELRARWNTDGTSIDRMEWRSGDMSIYSSTTGMVHSTDGWTERTDRISDLRMTNTREICGND